MMVTVSNGIMKLGYAVKLDIFELPTLMINGSGIAYGVVGRHLFDLMPSAQLAQGWLARTMS